MQCEVATGCSKSFNQFPAPQDGMVVVDDLAGDAAKASLFQTGTSQVQTMTIKARRAVRIPGSNEIHFVQEDLTLPRMN
jgi:hypothetical protein